VDVSWSSLPNSHFFFRMYTRTSSPTPKLFR
jgi:hypothetical protein